jgi:hypothetical protein
MAQKKRRKDMPTKPHRSRKPARSPLSIGDRVRVKDGVLDPDYEGQSIGGWAGTIIDMDDSSDPPLILLEWEARTLSELIGRKALERAERDGLQSDGMWLYLTDVERLDPTQGTEPPQPVNRAPKPRARYAVPLTDEEIRVTRLFGLPEPAGPPPVDNATLEVYHGYLCTRMRFPFVGEYSLETAPLEHVSEYVKVTGLADVDDCDEFYGLLCEGRWGRRQVVVPLAEVEVDTDDPNRQLIDDYQVWFWNYR